MNSSAPSLEAVAHAAHAIVADVPPLQWLLFAALACACAALGKLPSPWKGRLVRAALGTTLGLCVGGLLAPDPLPFLWASASILGGLRLGAAPRSRDPLLDASADLGPASPASKRPS
jgi:uncharacterized membrane protein YccC